MPSCRLTRSPCWWTCGPVRSGATSGCQTSLRSARESSSANGSTFPDGALNGRFVEQLRQTGVSDDVPIHFLCRSEVRSVAAAKAATAAGLGPAYNVSDGFEGHLGPDGHRDVTGWKTAGLPWMQG